MGHDELLSRRGFFGRTAATAGRAGMAGSLLVGFLALRGGNTPPAGARGPLGIVRPPGSVSEEMFPSACIRCTRCADSCETQCIDMFGPEAGRLQGTPYILPRKKGCNLCLLCGKTCPSGAIKPLENKEEARIGTAEVDKRLCVSHNGTGVCGACHTICPLKNRAITQGMHFAPEIDPDSCTGCGLCEEICIVDDPRAVRAIRIKTNRTLSAEAEGSAEAGEKAVAGEPAL